ncbi:MAG TPA: DinB family protein [archaeon]|nr:DinB family protein [archaeon]
MSDKLVSELEMIYELFQNSSDCLAEEDSNYSPKEGMMTVAQLVAHVARTIDWFMNGAFGPQGFDLDFEGQKKKILEVKSLSSARKLLQEAIEKAIKIVSGKSDEELNRPLSKGAVMGGEPRAAIIGAIADHTAHHRGALTVYSRLLGKTPRMPYGD